MQNFSNYPRECILVPKYLMDSFRFVQFVTAFGKYKQ